MGYYAHGNGRCYFNFYDWGCSLGHGRANRFKSPIFVALVFGALISPTDPVSGVWPVQNRQGASVIGSKSAGESPLFNDGVGVVVFTVMVAIAISSSGNGEALSVRDVAQLFVKEVLGGAALGLIAGYIGYRAMYQVDEYNLEILISLAVVMLSYFGSY